MARNILSSFCLIAVLLCIEQSSGFVVRGVVSSTIQRRTSLYMSGFGSKGKADDVKIGSGMSVARKQLANYEELTKAGEIPSVVSVRVRGTENKWLPVGKVVAEGGKIAAATQGQKRLIMEHAVILHSVLMAQKQNLEIGYAASADENAEIKTPGKDEYTGERVGLTLDAGTGGAYYKNTDQYGLAGRIDTSSLAGKSTKGNAGAGNTMKSSTKVISDS